MKTNASDKKKVSDNADKFSVMAIKVDRDIWRQFRSYCVLHDITCYEGLNQVLENFLKEKGKNGESNGDSDATS